MSTFEDWTRDIASRTEQALAHALPSEDEVPSRLHRAMRYASLNGGKRVRPMLTHASALACGSLADNAVIDAAAVAVELIHAYSLVHDDMPEMDNDVLRRGRPTVHVAFDVATALLVGDALQTRAFEVLAATGSPRGARMVLELAQAAGSRGMAGGQAIDLESVGRQLGRGELEQMHAMKTGALLRAAIRLGALAVSDLADDHAKALDAYAAAIGLAFQVVDDILDAESDTATLGKTAGKDAAADKPTYVSLLGLDASKALASDLLKQALTALGPLPGDTTRLAQIADFIVARSH
ncbi:MAG TPA: farnesyl diphosphate synthase [Burkholderiaceae bacterium]|nr:farnesyl diphosphate synthase [Burkholderiaceae bacterium]